nr:MAG TPA: replisome organizer [Caudoviricetes sp.]
MRDFAQIKLSIWNDDSFLDLSNNAQLLYFVLISHPTMNRAGVGTWHAGRLSGLCSSWSRPVVESAARELVDGLFIVIDEDTDEFLVRTFVRHDGLMKQRNLATTMAREFAAVGSRTIKGVVVWELRRLHEEHPEFKGWESDEALALLKKRAIDPSSDPSVDPSIHPKVDPYVEGAIDPKVHPSIDPSVKGEPKGSVDPSVDPSPTTATATTTNLRRFQEGVASDGVKGVRGKRGNQTGADDGSEPEASNPPPQNLDELAAAHAASQPDPRRCAEHQHLAPGAVPACGKCAEARRAFEERQEVEAEHAAQARRQAIADCDLCDENGMRDTGNGLTRCNHKPPRKKPPF